MNLLGKLLLLAAVLCACAPEDKEFVRPYFGPDLNNGEVLFYEYENSNEALFPLRYLLVKRDSLINNRYSYSFLNKDLEFQNGFIELRETDHIRIEKVLLPEKEYPLSPEHIHQVDLTQFVIPDHWAFDDPEKMDFKWTSAYNDTILFEMVNTWSLVGVDTAEVMGSKTDVIRIEHQELLRSMSSTGEDIMTLESEIDILYAHSIGMVALQLRTPRFDPVNLNLKAIHSKETYFKLIEQQRLNDTSHI